MVADEKRSIVVTGAGDSVGRLVAERFHALGDRVHIGDIRADAVKRTLQENPGMRGTAVNVGDPEEVANLFDEARSWMGPIDVLVNLVGIAGPRGAIEDTPIEAWRETIDVNLNGLFYCVRQVVPDMKRRRSGVIINFSSSSTRTRLPQRGAYVTSKYGVEGLTLNLARELGPFGIRCNAVVPGLIDNERANKVLSGVAESSGKTLEQVREEAVQFVSMRSVIAPQELVETVLFLTSEHARHITGQLLCVDGNTEWEI